MRKVVVSVHIFPNKQHHLEGCAFNSLSFLKDKLQGHSKSYDFRIQTNDYIR